MNTRYKKFQLFLQEQNPKIAGKNGEEHAKRWLDKSGWEYTPIEQGRTSLSNELRKYGGKRPDFIAERAVKNEIALLDVKYHKTENCKTFWLSNPELEKYRKLKSFVEQQYASCNVVMLFMVFPKEYFGKKFTWVDLCEFDAAKDYDGWTCPAKIIPLTDRNDLWLDNP